MSATQPVNATVATVTVTVPNGSVDRAAMKSVTLLTDTPHPRRGRTVTSSILPQVAGWRLRVCRSLEAAGRCQGEQAHVGKFFTSERSAARCARSSRYVLNRDSKEAVFFVQTSVWGDPLRSVTQSRSHPCP